MIKRLAAMIYTLSDRTMDPEAIADSMRLIKKSTSPFSYFRGNMILAVSALLSLQGGNQQQTLDKALKVYKKMKEAKFWGSPYLVIAACQIAIESGEDRFDALILRAKAFFNGMRRRHFVVTSSRDYITVTLLALSGIEVESGLLRMEEMYRDLKPKIHFSMGSQMIAQTLLIGNAREGGTERALSLCEAFRQRKLRLDRDYTYPLLGILALLGSDADLLSDEVIEAYKNIRQMKGFSSWSVYKYELLLYAGAFVAMDYIVGNRGNNTLSAVSTGITAMIVNQFIAILIMMTTSAVVASTVAVSAAGASS